MYLRSIEVEGYRASALRPITCNLPGRFSLLLGANGSGKTTINEAIVIAHRHRFPRLPSVDAAVLGPPPRAVRVEYAYEDELGKEGALGTALRARGYPAPSWGRPLERSLGRVRAGSPVHATEGHDNIRLIYLPALRNPVDELSRRDAQVLLELLRAEQLRRPDGRGLAGLRAQAEAMLQSLTAQQLVANLEGRIAEQLATLSGGVREHYAFVGTQRVDDAYLARVFEMLLATTPARGEAQRLEAASLGYVNLLHIAVTLAGIPEPSALSDYTDPDSSLCCPGGHAKPDELTDSAMPDTGELAEARRRLNEVSQSAEDDQDSFFPELFHATVLIEEPEAHLHPQMQYGLVRYLRRVVQERPDLQVIVTTHAGEMTAACDPSELVVVRRDVENAVVTRAICDLPLPSTQRRTLFQQTRLHLDATRSAALFGEFVLFVEGVTDAALLRVFGRAWALQDARKMSFIDALPIIPVGHKVGEWPVRLLATRTFELVRRVAVLSDTDRRGDPGDPPPEPEPPAWHTQLDDDSARFFWSQPTLEPSLVPGNEPAVGEALSRLGLSYSTPLTADQVDKIFRETGSRKKGEFAIILASELESRLADVVLPRNLTKLFDWLYEPVQRMTAADAPDMMETD